MAHRSPNSGGDQFTGGESITPSDSVALANPCKAIWVGGAGNISMKGVDDSSSFLLTGVPAGYLLQIRCKQVLATNTTATNLVALF